MSSNEHYEEITKNLPISFTCDRNLKVYLYNFNLELLKTQEGKEEILTIPLEWNIKIAEQLFKLVKIQNYNYNIVPQTFNTRRECMQYIGTDILRKYNENFHIEKTLEVLNDNENYVCEDFRYENELVALKNRGAIDYCIIRPNNFDYSNHLSEVSLNWTHFNNIIINNIPEKRFIRKFLNEIHNFNHLPKSRNNHLSLTKDMLSSLLKENNFDTSKVAKNIKCSRDKVVWWANKYNINIRNTPKYTYDNTAFLYASKEAAYYAGLLSADGCIRNTGYSDYNYVLDLSSNDYELVSGLKSFVKSTKPIYKKNIKSGNAHYVFTISNSFIIENIKLWNIKPRKSKFNDVPNIIRDNNQLMNYWILGLIDGDGSVQITKNNLPRIDILASKQIVDFISNLYNNLSFSIYQERKVENLYHIVFSGKNAISLYNSIYDPIALSRKWGKFEQYR